MYEENWKAVRPKLLIIIGNAMWISSLFVRFVSGTLKDVLFTVQMFSVAALGIVLTVEGVFMWQRANKEDTNK